MEFSGESSEVSAVIANNGEDNTKHTFAAMLEIEQQRNLMFGAVVTLEEQNRQLKEEIE